MDEIKSYHLLPDPFQSFENWYAEATKSEENANAMTLATSNLKGEVQARTVLYKGMHDRKIAIYTNLKSRKAQDLRENPRAALVFWWPNERRQIRISGEVEVMSEQKAKDYFHSRGRFSQIASLISQQSRPIKDRKELEKRFNEKLEELHKDQNKKVPFPSQSWGGFWLRPNRFEFFIYREHRLNDRFEYTLSDEHEDVEKAQEWHIQRLQP